MIIDFFTTNLLFTAGLPVFIFILILFFISIFFRYVLIAAIPLLIFSLYFFRNPERVCTEYVNDKSVIVSPADGKVLSIEPVNNGYAQKVVIFLSPFDVHVNWIPYDGTVEAINYRPGKFLVAYAPKSSEVNERNDIILNCPQGKILIRQIAGIVARRICCWINPGDSVKIGDKYGMIRFGSRVEVFVQSNVKIEVKEGQRVYGGQTVLARWV